MFKTSSIVEQRSPAVLVAVPAKTRRWLRRAAWLAVGCVILAVLGYCFRAPLLSGVAATWVVNEPVTKADAIVILGGGLENRPFAAASLFKEGVAPRILYMNVRLDPVESMGIFPPEGEMTRRLLLSNGIPETALTEIGTNVASTYDESRAVRAWLERSGAKSIAVTTDLFHTRRARWIFGKELRGTKTDIRMVAVDSPRYQSNDWWRHEEGVIAFQNEVIKYLYYRFKY